MGLRYPLPLIGELLEGVIAMEESVTYQAIMAKGEQKGELREAKRLLLLMGRQRFGPPNAVTRAAIEEIQEREKIEDCMLRLREAADWGDLLEAPPSRSRRKKGTT